MKKLSFFLLLLIPLAGCAELKNMFAPGPETKRQPPQYLTTQATRVEDTCPGHDIINPFYCSTKEAEGYTCFDVSMVQGDPIPAERYELLAETLTQHPSTPDPQCQFTERSCDAFLKKLNYNLDFSWFITDFPSSSFAQCQDTYSCTQIACFFPPPAVEQTLQQKEYAPPATSDKLSCTYKKNHLFFVGSQITCN